MQDLLIGLASNPPSWMKFACYAALLFLALDFGLVILRWIAVRNKIEESQEC